MFTRFVFVLCALLGSVTANAGLVTIEYSGTVTGVSNGGWGASVGQKVGGVIEIDLSKADGKMRDEANAVSYYAATSNGMVKSDSASNSLDGGADFVDIFNNSRPGDNLDYLWLDEKTNYSSGYSSGEGPSTYSWKYTGIQLGILLPTLDWITDLSLNNINLDIRDSAILASSFGVFTYGSFMSDTATGAITYSDSRASFFAFDWLKITSPSAQVPESGSLFLILIAALGLLLRRSAI